MNNAQKIEIDLSLIDSEIAQYQEQIDKLQFEIDFRRQLKQYAIKYTVPNIDTPHVIVNNHKEQPNPANGISEFIIDFVARSNGRTGREVAEAYADFLHAEYKDIRNNVFNALSRLKSANKIRADIVNGLSIYHKSEESSQEAA